MPEASMTPEERARKAIQPYDGLAEPIIGRRPYPDWMVSQVARAIREAEAAARQDERQDARRKALEEAAGWHEERSREDFRLAELADAAGQVAAEREWRTSAARHLSSANHFRTLAAQTKDGSDER